MKTHVLLFFVLISFISCKNKQNDIYTKAVNSNTKNLTQEEQHPGKKLMETYCYACHDATTTEDKRLGPPMIAIKMRYIFKNTTKDEFITDMKNWMKNPNAKDAKMFGAVKRFGIMPISPYPEKDIEQIADYIFDNKIDEPEWFQEHYQQNGGINN